MPTHEDIFLLHLVLDKGLLSSKEISNPLCLLYKQEISGKKNSLAKILEQMHLVSQSDLEEIQSQILKILEENRPQDVIFPSMISLKDCKRQKILGKSSLGTTYHASHPQLGDFVYKCFEGIIAQNKKFLRHFLNQLKKGESFSHKNWGQIYKIESYEGVILRELIVGESLEDYMSKGKIPFGEATKIVYEICQGLNAAYQVGLFHKNLKPSNIILESSKNAVVVDGSLPPTIPNYLAPEQWQKKKSDQRSDIYSLGMIYSHMLNGITVNQTPLEKEQKESLFSPSISGEEVPEKILCILQKMLAYEPENRYQDYEELIADLYPFCREEEPEEQKQEEPEEQKQEEIEIPENIEEASEETTEASEEAAIDEEEEEDSLMNTAMMATVPPSADVIKYRRAKRIAKEIVQEFWISFEDEIIQACLKDRFYDDLAPFIRTSQKRFQLKMAPASVENMPYLDEAWESLRNKVIQKQQSEKAIQAEAVPDKEEMEAQVSEAVVEETPKPKGFIPINEKEIKEIEFEAQEATLAEPSESAFEEFSTLDGQVSEAAIEAVSEEEPIEEQSEDWDKAMTAVAISAEEEQDSQLPPSLPEEKDFEINFHKKPSIKPAFSKSAPLETLPEPSKGEQNTEEKMEEAPKKSVPFPSINKLKPFSAHFAKENKELKDKEESVKPKAVDSLEKEKLPVFSSSEINTPEEETFPKEEEPGEKTTSTGGFPGIKKETKLKPYFFQQDKQEED